MWGENINLKKKLIHFQSTHVWKTECAWCDFAFFFNIYFLCDEFHTPEGKDKRRSTSCYPWAAMLLGSLWLNCCERMITFKLFGEAGKLLECHFESLILIIFHMFYCVEAAAWGGAPQNGASPGPVSGCTPLPVSFTTKVQVSMSQQLLTQRRLVSLRRLLKDSSVCVSWLSWFSVQRRPSVCPSSRDAPPPSFDL